MIRNSYILNIDVLGFGDFVEQRSVQDVFDYYSQIITGAAYAGDIVDEGNVEVMVYSDTIAITCKNNDENVCLDNLVMIAYLIQTGPYYRALSKDALFLPVRGTITFGEFLFHKGDIWTQAHLRPKIHARNIAMILGKPIVEGYKLEKELELMCVVMADSARDRAEGATLDALMNSNRLLEYEMPLKEGGSKSGVVVNPVTTPHLEVNLQKLRHECKKHKDGSSTKDKYLNTIKLFEFVAANKRFY